MKLKINPKEYNSTHFYFFIKAEIARLKNDMQNAIIYYNKALQHANKTEDKFIVALINECASYFFYKNNLMDYAKLHLLNAHDAYANCKATLKCKLLETRYNDWFKTDEKYYSPAKKIAGNKFEIDLRYALENNELSLYYQPIFSSKNIELAHFEALIRWQHPEHGFISPAHFIPLAEATKLILPISEWVIKTACQQISAWREGGYPLVPIAINISGLQFTQQPLVHLIKKYIHEYNIDTRYLELEFTESILIENTEKIKNDILALKNLNIRITIDDFGTYYSNLSYLKHFSVDKIKIDKTFVRDLSHCNKDRSVIVAIVTLAHSLGLKVVAEGVETEAQLAYLREQKVDELQGYYFSKPISHDECSQYLLASTHK